MRCRFWMLILFAAGLVRGTQGYAQVQQAWVARYNGPGNREDFGAAITLDRWGVCVTGSSRGYRIYGNLGVIDFDYATVQYDPNGNPLWIVRYDGPGSPPELARAITVDSGANLYVVGSGGVVKYDSNGQPLWVVGTNFGAAFKADSVGNIYVTGALGTAKFDANGKQLWMVRTNGGAALTLDRAGNVYVTGAASAPYSNFTTVKYDTDGNQRWIATYHGPLDTADNATAIAEDKSLNVFVTGSSASKNIPIENGFQVPVADIVTVKYNVDGKQVWVARYDGPGDNLYRYDIGRAITLDPFGNVCITGNSYGGGVSEREGIVDLTTIKYDADGNQLWVARFHGVSDYDEPLIPNGARAMASDAAANIYVTGGADGRDYIPDYATLKYDRNGNQLWVARYDGPGNNYDVATALALDTAGNVYVTGGSYGAWMDFATVKYTQIKVAGLPIILAQPQSETLLAGSNVTFIVTATGTNSLNYQWRFNTRDIAGATNASLVVSNVQSGNSGEYSVQVSNSVGVTASPVARLTVIYPPWIISQPRDLTVAVGTNVTLTVVPTSEPPLSYQWQLNGTNIPGATNAVLEIKTVQATDDGNYAVVVSSPAISVTSGVATLTVITSPPNITTQPISQTIAAGADVTLEVAAGSRGAVSYQWQFNGTTISGATNDFLRLNNAQSSDSGNYTVISRNIFGAVTSEPATLTVLPAPPSITLQPVDRTVALGSTVTFTVIARGSSPLSYQWQVNNTKIGGATNPSLILGDVGSSGASAYTVVVTNAFGSVTSEPARLIVRPSPVLSISRSDGGMSNLLVQAKAEGAVVFEASAELASWTPIASTASNVVEISEAEARDWGKRFYRAKLIAMSEPLYSANAVGFVYLTIPAGGFALLGNPFNQLTNDLATILAGVPANTRVYKLDPLFRNPFEIFVRRSGFWTGVDASGTRLNPGVGFFVYHPSSELNFTFIGEVPEGTFNVPIQSGFNLLSSPLPRAGFLESQLGLPAQRFDRVYVLTDNRYSVFTRLATRRINGIWAPSEPFISVAQGFWLMTSTSNFWTRTFLP